MGKRVPKTPWTPKWWCLSLRSVQKSPKKHKSIKSRVSLFSSLYKSQALRGVEMVAWCHWWQIKPIYIYIYTVTKYERWFQRKTPEKWWNYICYCRHVQWLASSALLGFRPTSQSILDVFVGSQKPSLLSVTSFLRKELCDQVFAAGNNFLHAPMRNPLLTNAYYYIYI